MIIKRVDALHATLMASGTLAPIGFQRDTVRVVIEPSERGSRNAVTDHAKEAAKGACCSSLPSRLGVSAQ
jgi:hypothetical protein